LAGVKSAPVISIERLSVRLREGSELKIGIPAAVAIAPAKFIDPRPPIGIARARVNYREE
jgi:hypothetical protein